MLTALENLYSVPFLDITREATKPFCARGVHHLDAFFPATCKLYDQKKIGPNIWTAPSVVYF